jgi:hypothetical protein
MTTLAQHPHVQSATECRISFRQPVSRSGGVDAAWWPRSNDLTAEMPALLEVFWTAGRDMARITYNLDSWDVAPRRMQIEGNRVHLGGYHYQNSLLLGMADASHGDTADLLIIPFDTDPEMAERLLDLGSETDNTNTPEQMMELAKP